MILRGGGEGGGESEILAKQKSPLTMRRHKQINTSTAPGELNLRVVLMYIINGLV